MRSVVGDKTEMVYHQYKSVEHIVPRTIASSPPLRGFIEGEVTDSDGHNNAFRVRGALPASAELIHSDTAEYMKMEIMTEEYESESDEYSTYHGQERKCGRGFANERRELMAANMPVGSRRQRNLSSHPTVRESLRRSAFERSNAGPRQLDGDDDKAKQDRQPNMSVHVAHHAGRKRAAMHDESAALNEVQSLGGQNNSLRASHRVRFNDNTNGPNDKDKTTLGCGGTVKGNTYQQIMSTMSSNSHRTQEIPSTDKHGQQTRNHKRPCHTNTQQLNTSHGYRSNGAIGVPHQSPNDPSISHALVQTRHTRVQGSGSVEASSEFHDYHQSDDERTQNFEFAGRCFYSLNQHSGENNVIWCEDDPCMVLARGEYPRTGRAGNISIDCSEDSSHVFRPVVILERTGERHGWISDDAVVSVLKGLLAGGHEIQGHIMWINERVMPGSGMRRWEGKTELFEKHDQMGSI
ncbi:hypothetical protein BJ508DRAFT_334816 [Ascobolus immersus RN42]|uniref:Uncharacterized protein n=1 Tax=Ascobolus immersus RN42 TaxID=1160509 RepID=A0A3N4HI81_ASCIM|nr:hypothetical protein BJ508DRAFT_336695 [Ascobolus immersus RN42]RPA72696.1 hypothetical protein BJ508DRAFT_334816 [Ascobolus immersus RN42]